MEAPPLKLVMVQGPRQGETLDFRPGSIIRIGRVVRGNTIAIKDAGVSSKHFAIESSSSSGSGKWILHDLDSSNGTTLNATKVLPDTPYDLHDGDCIKIGEYTSILVQIGGHNESQVRRNPRRRATEKDAVEPVPQNRGRRCKVSKETEDKCQQKGEELETVNQRRGRQRKAAVLKREDATEELCDRESENSAPVEGKPGRQGSTRRTRSAKNEEPGVSEPILEPIPESSAVERGEVKGKKTWGGGRRRGRRNLSEKAPDCTHGDAFEHKENVEENNWEKENRIDVDNGAAVRGVDDKVGNEADASFLEARMDSGKNLEEIRIDVDNGAAVGGVDDKVGNGADTSFLEVGMDSEKYLEESRIDVDDGVSVSGVDHKLGNGADSGVKLGGLDLKKDLEEKNRINVDNEVAVNGGYDKVGNGAESGVIREELDLEKITLGEWFDYMEVQLPKQIIDATEGMIEGMRRKAERVREYMVQQRNEKAKVLVE